MKDVLSMAEDNSKAGLAVTQDIKADHRSGFVAVIGRPNVGKSTLLNAYLGQKLVIVSDKPQTTRDNLLGILTLSAAQVIFVDTPGIHRPLHKLGTYMVERAIEAIKDADVVLFMVDLTFRPGKEDRLVAEALNQAKHGHTILVMNKIDLLPEEEQAERCQAYLSLAKTDEQMTISALNGYNRDTLFEHVITALPLGPRYFPEEQVTDQQERFLAAELIREQVLRYTHQEIPHSVAVIVDEFKERHEDLTYISARILVEKDSQKGILIGEKGKMLKQIGAEARSEMEDMLGRKVYLELWVKVYKKWRSNEAQLRRLGYSLPTD
jgi:GTP-binding protein Era